MPRKTPTYRATSPIPKAHVRDAFSDGTPAEIEQILVSVALHEEDYDFGLATIVGQARSPQPGIRGTAIFCLAHLARIHGRLPDDPVIEIVQSGLADASEYVRGQSENAADDIEVFIPTMGRRIRRTAEGA